MKSYFSKLAARATLANAPATKTVNARNAHDPFEATVTSPDITPRSDSWSTHSLSDLRPTTSDTSAAPSPKSIELTPRAKPTVTPGLKSSTIVAPASNEPETSITRTTEISQLPPRDVSESPKSKRVESHDLELTSINNLPQLSPEARTSQRPIPTTPTTETKEPLLNDDNVSDRLVNIENEQAVLLRKADAFMAGLFDRQRRSMESQREEREVEDQESVAKVERPIQPSTRLQPLPAPARVSEPADEEPSLIIGKLSVEVVQAPAPAVTPQRQVVVIGGGRRTRDGIPSAHRFGFSRF